MRTILVAAAIALLVAGCGDDTPTDPSQVNIEFSATDLVVGTGTEAVPGNAVAVNYTLWLYNPAGTDSKGRQLETGPFQFLVGRGQVIPGFDQGVLGMRVGGRRRLYIPASLAYGSQGSSGVPPNAALVFEVELVAVQ